jgi:hypothetical protein
VGWLSSRYSAARFVAPVSHASSSTRPAPVACTLLGTADATTALGATSLPGKELIDATGCMWSHDPAASDSSTRIALNTHSPVAFHAAAHPAITTITIEPVAGIGDEVFYQIYPGNASPFIWVRKGTTTFSIRILTRLDPKPFTNDQETAKLAVLAKAAVAKL